VAERQEGFDVGVLGALEIQGFPNRPLCKLHGTLPSSLTSHVTLFGLTRGAFENRLYLCLIRQLVPKLSSFYFFAFTFHSPSFSAPQP
jgi:hypothetical protein